MKLSHLTPLKIASVLALTILTSLASVSAQTVTWAEWNTAEQVKVVRNTRGNGNAGRETRNQPLTHSAVLMNNLEAIEGKLVLADGTTVSVVKTATLGPVHTIIFSKPVKNLELNIVSTGKGSESVFIFEQEFIISAQDPRCVLNSSLKHCMMQERNSLRSNQSSGSIRLSGEITQISWIAVSNDSDLRFNVGIPNYRSLAK